MTSKGNSGENALGTLVLAYLDSAQHARTDRHRISQQAKVLITREKEITHRTRIQADADIARERELTERESIRCRADVEIHESNAKPLSRCARPSSIRCEVEKSPLRTFVNNSGLFVN